MFSRRQLPHPCLPAGRKIGLSRYIGMALPFLSREKVAYEIGFALISLPTGLRRPKPLATARRQACYFFYQEKKWVMKAIKKYEKLVSHK
jgi:hypothetical protein